ncbi:MAG: DEAD/DEAH box helicase [Cyanothece sp. SIO1E1]|nr:DEAD/DEAH box helicase [Cyanothece sp. SIO1E1]
MATSRNSKQKKVAPQPVVAPAWLSSLNLQRLLDSGSVFKVAEILRHQYLYERSPVLEATGKATHIAATLYSPYGTPTEARANVYPRPIAAIDPTQPVPVTLSSAKSAHAYGAILGIQATCNTLNNEVFGEPAQALLVDLALYPALREAIAKGEPTEPLMADLPAIRAQAYRDYVAHQALKDWAPKEQTQVAAAPEYFIQLYDTTEPENYYRSFRNTYQHNPVLEVKPRLMGKRAILSKEEKAELRFPPIDGQILRTCRDHPYNRKGFYADGTDAGLVLHLLESRNVLIEGENVPVTFAETPVFLKMVTTRMPRYQVGVRHTLSTEDPRQHNGTIYRPARENSDPTLQVEVNALAAHWYTRDGVLEVASADTIYIPGLHSYIWLPDQRTFYPVSPLIDLSAAWRLFLRPSVELVEGHAPMLYRAFRGALQGTMIALPGPTEMGLSPAETPEFVVRIDGSPLEIKLSLEAHYSFGICPLFPGPSVDELVSTRDLEREAAALEQITRLNFWENVSEKTFVSSSEDVAAGFWLEGIEQLQQADPPLTLMIPTRLRATRMRRQLQARLRVSLVSDWFETEIHLQTEDLQIDLAQLQAAIAEKKRWVLLNDGSLAELTETLRDLLQDSLDVLPTTGKGQLPIHQIGRLNQWLQSAAIEVETDEQVEALRSRSALMANLSQRAIASDDEAQAQTLAITAPEIPASLQAQLRPYQRQGLAWLQFLYGLSAGGILADDMGLGKTLMTLALLTWRQEQEGTLPNLIVCPTSVTTNWIKETLRFAPTLRALLLTGKVRESLREAIATHDQATAAADVKPKGGKAKGAKAKATKAAVNVDDTVPLPQELQDVDLMVTTYGLLRRDVDMLKRIRCRYIILDEAQNIKNYNTATAKAARQLQAEAKLALSGTPVENRLAELYSIMDFCNSGMLGSKATFSKRYEYPILSDSRGAAARRLRAMIRPFVLRRTKHQVLKDLPPKQEIEYTCVLGSTQQQQYDALAALIRGDIGEKIQQEGLEKNQIKLLTALLRLRQMACEPRLVDRLVPPGQSTKRNEFLKLVRELVSEGRRALVFSQFVELLQLWKRDLEREGIAYEYLDGSTKDREAVVTAFQHGDAPLFLISLKAGGTGLNLTAADTVIHCDPWWNPAVEAQATDRAHRIGQTKPVTVYRLVAAGTVEEKIIELKARKQELADAVITDDAAALQGLSVDDVQHLLGNVATPQFEEKDLEEKDEDGDAADADTALLPEDLPNNLAPSILAQTTGADLAAIAQLMKDWMAQTSKKQKDIAKYLGISSHQVGLLLRGKLKALPTLEANRIRGLLEEK